MTTTARRLTRPALVGLMALLLTSCGAAERADTSSQDASSAPASGSDDPTGGSTSKSPTDGGTSGAAPSGDAPAGEVLGTATATVANFGSDTSAQEELRLDVVAVDRLPGDGVSVRFALTNLSGANDFRFYDQFAEDQNVTDLAGATLDHVEGDTRYLTLQDSEGGCLCSEVGDVLLPPGGSSEMSAQFAAPPQDAQATFTLPGFAGVSVVVP